MGAVLSATINDTARTKAECGWIELRAAILS